MLYDRHPAFRTQAGTTQLFMKRIFAVFVLFLPVGAAGHEIPADVTVRVFIRPVGNRLELLVRVPLEAMRDMQVPTRERGFLDLSRVDDVLRDAAILWIADYVEIFEGQTLLENPEIVAVRASLPSNIAFARFETARDHVTSAPLSEDTEIYWDQGVLDVLFEYPIRSEGSEFSINPGLERLGVRVINIIRFLPPDGILRELDFPGNPGRIPLDPNWGQVAFRFSELGFFHILDGLDHLLFLFCLVIPFRRFRSLVVIVTSFTMAHSMTLIASALGYAPDALWFPPLIETLIALSILYMAFENIAGASLKRRWLITFGFGLIHGFGFSFVLRETFQFAGSHLVTSLLAFNVGVELGQLLVLVLIIPALELFFRYGVVERIGTIFLSVLVAHSAWHWMVERGSALSQFGWPVMDAAFFAGVLQMLMFAVLFAALVWLWGLLRPSTTSGPEDEPPREA